MSQDFNSKIKSATKWSTITEITAKLVTPISSMVLARLLTPEAFGVIATLTMIISFVEVFTDAGFQKYIIQHEFKGEKDLIESTNVAFWSNLLLSLVIWGIIAVFSEQIATVVGNQGLGYVITIACVSIPLEALSSIQMALYKRDFDFKTLFKVRLVGILIPLIVTIPLAFVFRNFWALLWGTIAKDVFNAILLTYFSKWKPKLYYKKEKLKEMLSFSIWSMLEQVSIWLNSYVDVFIVGVFLSTYFLGVYRTGCTTVTQIMGLITTATMPILFSSLSRIQNNREQFIGYYLRFLKWVGLFVLPLGFVFLCYSDLIVSILLGSQWGDAYLLVSLWGFTEAFKILFSNFCSEAFRALGYPKLSLLSQVILILIVIPVVYFSAQRGFTELCIYRSLVKFVQIAIQLSILFFLIKLSLIKMMKNLVPELSGCLIFVAIHFLFKLTDQSLLYTIFSLSLSCVLYILYLMLFKKEREVILTYSRKLKLNKMQAEIE